MFRKLIKSRLIANRLFSICSRHHRMKVLTFVDVQNVGGSRVLSTYTNKCETALETDLKSRMKADGPITVADYMKAILTSPVVGYYMNRDVFGQKGDFITSPEISQMFGELIGIWCVNEWMQHGSPKKVNIVELGPGRGTLAEDMLRVFNQFKELKEAVSLHLVEISPKLMELQMQRISGANVPSVGLSQENGQQQCVSHLGFPVYWYKDIKDVPKEFSIFIAHEFLDALPIHKFQKTDRGWCEVCVDVNPDREKTFRYVLSPGPTLASSSILQVENLDQRDHIEVSPESGAIIQELSARICEAGGAALIADYGHNGDKTDTFRAFKQHKLHDALVDPGTADLTADVDFSYLRKSAGNKVICHGPITQETFLHNMGIGLRLQVLLQKADTKQRKDLITGYDMLTNPDKMGERFKFFSLTQKGEIDYKPAGFVKP